jgi:Na+/H+-dicarboxylate symporter
MRLSLTTQIFLGMLAGSVIGVAMMLAGAPGDSHLVQVVKLAGDLFLQLLKMVIVPLILASMVTGVTSMGSVGNLGRVGKQTFLFYLMTVLIAVAIGLVLVNVLQPGIPLREQTMAGGPLSEEAAGTVQKATERPTAYDLVRRLVPENPFRAMADMDVLGIIVFALILGFALLSLGPERAEPLTRFFESLNQAVMRIVGFVMRLAPFGVGAIIAYMLASRSPEDLRQLVQGLAIYSLCVVLGLLLQFGAYLGLTAWMGRVNPFRFTQTCAPLLATAFGTASSNATLPVTFECVERAGVSRKISGFVLPIGATANMDGTALYEAVAAIFIAQAYGIHLGFGQQIIVALTAILAAVGAAGIPSAGLVTMGMVLTAAGLPLEGIALLYSVDRILDMCRTAINVMGDAVACRVIQTWNPGIGVPELTDIPEKPLAHSV